MSTKKKESGTSFLERMGNKMPHTMTLFLSLAAMVMILSCIFSVAGIVATDFQTGEVVEVVNLLSIDGLLFLLTTLVANFGSFPILGVTLVVGIAMGLCEESGFFAAAIKFGFRNVKAKWVALLVSFFGVFMCSFDGAVSHIVVATLAGIIYLSMGKNPMIGVISGYAAAATGSAMEFVPAFWQVCLTPLTVQYAQIFDPSFTMPLLSDYYVMVPASCIAVLINAYVTVKFIEPRFATYHANETVLASVSDEELTPLELKAVKKACLGIVIFLLAVVVACIPESSFFRGPSGSLIIDAPLMTAFENLLFILFFVPGFIYAKEMGLIHSMKDLVKLLEKGLAGLLSFIVLVLVISQFTALFSASNLAKVISLLGGEFLMNLSVPAVVIIVIVFVAYALINLLIVSGSTKYMIFGSIFVPMFMRLNFHPAFTQLLMRLGDATTNQVSPLNPFFPIVLALGEKYDKDMPAAKIMGALVPYAIANGIAFTLILLVCYFTQCTLGVGGATIWLG